jgi:hypothetical protein
MLKTTSTAILMAIAILSLPSAAHSQPKESHGIGVNGSIGTLGIGVNLNKSITSQLGARLGVNFGSIGANQSNSGVDYNANLDLGSAQLLADFYPFGGGLRLTGGLMYQNNRLSVTSKPTNGNSYTINNTQYSAADVGALKGEFQYGNSIAPYVGIGFGQAKQEGFGFNADLGVLFTGAPKVNLNATNPVFNNNPTTRSAIDAQIRQTENDLKGFTVYPVLSVGISYGF